jgi:hypothetical protein
MAGNGKERKGVSRREFLKVAGTSAAITELLAGCKSETEAEAATEKVVRDPPSPNCHRDAEGERQSL